MSYHRLEDVCDNYNQYNTSNKKYTNPFNKKTGAVAIYKDNNYNLNSYKFNHDNFYPQSKTYDYVQKSYAHYISQLLIKRDNLIQEERQAINASEEKPLVQTRNE